MKRIAFIAVREPQYSRVSIVRRALHQHFEVVEFLSTRRTYAGRLCSILFQLLSSWCAGGLKSCDGVVVGFLAQPIFPLVRWLYRGPIIADAYFSIFDTLVHDKGRIKATSILGRLCHGLDATMFRQAEMCLTDTNAHAAYFKTEFEVPEAEMHRLWIGAETRPLGRHPAAPRADEPFEVFFWGGFIPLQGVETIIQAASLLRSRGVRFTLIGNGQTFANCEQLRRQWGADNVDFQGWKSLADIQTQAEQSHLALGIFGSTDKAARVIPNKVFEALAMGIPLITRRSAAVEELLTDHHDVYMVPAADAKQLAEKILWVREHYTEACQVAQQGQRTFLAAAAPEQLARTLQRQIERLVPQPAVLQGAPSPLLAAARRRGHR